jgi:hypothetical protein
VNESYAVKLSAQDVALKTQLGVVDGLTLENQKRSELNLLLEQQKINEQEYGAALAQIPRAVKEIIDAQEVRLSTTPALTKLRQEAEDTRAVLDSELSSALRGSLADLRDYAKGASSLGDTLEKLGERFEDAALNALFMKGIIGPLSSLASGGVSSIFSTTTPGVPLDLLSVTKGHTGGVVGALSNRSYVHPAVFADAPRFHGGGIIGDEVPVIARKGEAICWPDQLAAKYGGGGGDVHFNFSTITIPSGSNVTRADVEAGMKAAVAQIVPTVRDAMRRHKI